MNEDFVSFSLAKRLKGKGFPQYTEKSYFVGDHKKRMCSVGTFLHVHTQNTEHLIAAPTLSQVLKWLREVHNIFIVIEPYMYDYINEKISSYVTSLWQGDNYYENITSKDYPTYEEAAIAGVEYVIDNLI